MDLLTYGNQCSYFTGLAVCSRSRGGPALRLLALNNNKILWRRSRDADRGYACPNAWESSSRRDPECVWSECVDPIKHRSHPGPHAKHTPTEALTHAYATRPSITSMSASIRVQFFDLFAEIFLCRSHFNEEKKVIGIWAAVTLTCINVGYSIHCSHIPHNINQRSLCFCIYMCGCGLLILSKVMGEKKHKGHLCCTFLGSSSSTPSQLIPFQSM